MKIRHPSTPANTRIYAIGDVHGRTDLLDDLLAQVLKDSKTAKKFDHILVMLGDYIDRGPNSKGVLNRLHDLQTGHLLKGFKCHFLKGNHEDALLNFLAGRHTETWLNFGGQETLNSYRVEQRPNLKAVRADLLKALPKEHRRILRNLQYSVVIGEYGFVHAGLRPHVRWADQNPDDLMWIREQFLQSNAKYEYMIIHGHSPTDQPTIQKNRIGIDTRAWSSGKLTCLVLQGTSQRFLTT